ncbi:uncharacterized protein si:ch211-197h24.8 [Centropristis striata]|uniref:uncharacterized protein si:ch211-197h24.8 n=1 Tax=Centropristis striata TaxID=184440 RepID=UPI0027DF9C17|nr:uncharacterized protein si:ch211-197h24.8 [Centropristis striata]
MKPGYTNRGYRFSYAEKEHLKLNDLKSNARGNNYLSKENIPPYPQPEFHVSHLKHDTNREGLEAICGDNGFRCPGGNSGILDVGPLLWWSLVVGPDKISAAEKRLLENTYPDRTTEQVQKQKSFLEKFATSPAFSKTSRLGSYRFTFPVEELLTAYSEQSGDQETPELQRPDVTPPAQQAEGLPAVQRERPVRPNHLQGGLRGRVIYLIYGVLNVSCDMQFM